MWFLNLSNFGRFSCFYGWNFRVVEIFRVVQFIDVSIGFWIWKKKSRAFNLTILLKIGFSNISNFAICLIFQFIFKTCQFFDFLLIFRFQKMLECKKFLILFTTYRFSMPHDDDSKCTKFRNRSGVHKVMSRMLDADTFPWEWSKCSRHYVTEFLEWVLWV